MECGRGAAAFAGNDRRGACRTPRLRSCLHALANCPRRPCDVLRRHLPLAGDGVQTISALRPWLLLVLGRIVQRREEAAAAAVGGGVPLRVPAAHEAALSPDEAASVALSFVLSLAPHAAPLVLRFFAVSPTPLARFKGEPAASVLPPPPEAAWPAARALVRAALRLADAAAACGEAPLQRAVGAAACSPTALRLARHLDAHVRFAAVRLAATGLALAARQADALRRTVLTPEEVRACCRKALPVLLTWTSC